MKEEAGIIEAMKEDAGIITAKAGDEGAGVSAASSEPMPGMKQEDTEQEDAMQEDKPDVPQQYTCFVIFRITRAIARGQKNDNHHGRCLVQMDKCDERMAVQMVCLG